ncbi:MAG TPA: S8 family serine peptidase [Roseiflexaceae bacterium]|nr:S8 family serine peptidase [Roseiflexaceae bacterium]
MNRRVALLALLIVLLIPPARPASAASGFRSGELVVRLRNAALSPYAVASGASVGPLNAALRQIGAFGARPLGGDTYRLLLATRPDAAARALAGLPGVVYAEPNHERDLLRSPSDALQGSQWSLGAVRAPEAWDLSTGEAIIIALLDTGVSPTHLDLKRKLLPGYDFVNGDADPRDDEGHGTHTAGVAAADTDNSIGIAGVCWGCMILPVKVLGNRGRGDDATIAQGIRYAVDQGARVIGMSLGGPEDTQVLRDAVRYAYERRVLIVAASGNGQMRGNAPSYPAAYPEVLAVSATDERDEVAGFATTGPFIGLAAPGVNVWSTTWERTSGDSYGPASGTSDAAPHVVGAAALVLSLRPDLTSDQLAEVLKASADDIGLPGRDPQSGYGRLNIRSALELAAQEDLLARSRIEGTLSGAPLEGATVSLNDGPPVAPDPAGFYRFDLLPAGSYTVTVRWADGAVAQQSALLSGTPLGVATLNFTRAPNATSFFLPVNPPSDAALRFFPETGHTLGGAFRAYWERNGGLPIFGFPTSEPFTERGEDGRDYTVQYFQRHRFELHPENPPPYDVLLSRLGDTVLRQTGRDWVGFPQGGPQPGCRFFAETGHSVCGIFLAYWRAHGLELDGRPGATEAESLALFGMPLSEPQLETMPDGRTLLVQWFERARFEDHGGDGVLLGLLSNELAQARGWR